MLPRALGLMFLLALSSLNASAGEVQWSQSRVDFLHYQAELNTDDKRKLVSGSVAIDFAPLAQGVATLSFSIPYHRIYSVALNHKPQAYQLDNHILTIAFEQPLVKGETYQVNIDYGAKPKKGFVFHPLRSNPNTTPMLFNLCPYAL